MGTMAVTGSASGMGAAIVSRLEGRGDRVITVDLHDAAVVADLSTVQGRVDAAHKVLELSEGHIDGAVNAVKVFGPVASPMIYAASKIAVTRWVRRRAVSPSWVDEGIRMNVLAPGAIMTPLLQEQLNSPSERKEVESFPLPTRTYGTADGIARWVVMMLSDATDFMCGSVVFVDGGIDAYLRPNSWPRQVPGAMLPVYLWRFRQWAKRKGLD